MSNPDFFSEIDPKNIPNKPEPIDNDYEDESNCPSCSFVLSKHSVKQILNCARKEISLVLGVEKK